MDSSQGGALDASSAPAGRAETAETMGSSQGGAGNASSVPTGKAESDSGASAASGTDQGNGGDAPAVLSGRAAPELISWVRLPATVRGRARDQSQLRMQHEIVDALLAAAYELTMSGSILKSTSRTTGDAMALMAG